MIIKKAFKFNTNSTNKIQASATLHQRINCGGSNPVNITNVRVAKVIINLFYKFSK
jgi:hypothetical protein